MGGNYQWSGPSAFVVVRNSNATDTIMQRVDALMKQGKWLDDIKKEVKMPEYASWGSQDRMPTNVEAAYKALFARTPPGAAIQFVALRLSVTAPMPGTGGKLELPRHALVELASFRRIAHQL